MFTAFIVSGLARQTHILISDSSLADFEHRSLYKRQNDAKGTPINNLLAVLCEYLYKPERCLLDEVQHQYYYG